MCHHKTWFIEDFSYGICKYVDRLGIHKSADRIDLKWSDTWGIGNSLLRVWYIAKSADMENLYNKIV